jgi:lipopolysaccharide export system protein LptA
VTVSAQPTATLSGGTFCTTGTTTLTTTGATGGTFSATPAGLVIDATTGQIDLAASTPNTYDITYSFGTAPCTGTATSQVTISNQPTATVSGGTFCTTGTTTLTTTGATGGTFSATPAGLVIDPATGVIDLAASTPGLYDITYSFGTAPCTGTATSQVTISNQPTATVSGGTFCTTGTTTLTTTGATGGTFSATPAGLVIDATTGQIDLAASTPNTYDITYSFGTAPCTGTATSQVTISNNPTATVSGGTFCTTGTTTLTTTGATGGTFSATPAGLVIDPVTGVIDLAASTPNTYDITYSFGTAPCTGTATSQVTVSNNPTATVSGGTFCVTGTTTLTTTGATGGTFSATPAGLVIDPATGVIDLAASTPNTYDITYSFGTAPCTGTATSQVTVSAQPTATVSGGTFCTTGQQH